MKFKKNLIVLLSLLQLSFPLLAADTPVNRKIKISSVGDVMLGRRLTPVLKEKGFEWPFQEVKQYLENADITFCNLEAPFSNRGKIIPKQYNFRAIPESVECLRNAGFDIVSLANNHCLDYNVEALQDTIKTLDQAGIRYCGLYSNSPQQPTIIEKNGLKIAFLAYSDISPSNFSAKGKNLGVSNISEESIKEIKQAKNLADIVIVSAHWGIEKQRFPSKKQKEYARAFIDAGASLVLGSHPHVLQPIERYKKGVIAYSLGNFVFGCVNSIRNSAIFDFYLNGDQVDSFNVIPVNINSNETGFQPKLLEGKEKQKIESFLVSTYRN